MLSQQAKTFGDFGIEVRQAVGECDTTCPQCSGQRKNRKARCLSVNVDKGTWFCHHCGWSGGLGTGTRQLDPPWQKPTWRSPPPMVPAIGSAGFDWLASRGISREVAQRNGVCMASVYMPQVEEHVTAVCFPYYRGEIVVNRKYRDGKKNFRMEAGAERILYGLNDIEPARCVSLKARWTNWLWKWPAFAPACLFRTERRQRARRTTARSFPSSNRTPTALTRYGNG